MDTPLGMFSYEMWREQFDMNDEELFDDDEPVEQAHCPESFSYDEYDDDCNTADYDLSAIF